MRFYRTLGSRPADDWGCSTQLVEDDGSAGFADLYRRAHESPVVVG
jgi:hypothetical protein